MYLTGLRDICRFMAARGAGGGAAGLTRAVLAEYWMQAGLKRERATRRMLLGFAALGDGRALGAGWPPWRRDAGSRQARGVIRWRPMSTRNGRICRSLAGGSPMSRLPSISGRWRLPAGWNATPQTASGRWTTCDG